MYLVDTNVLSAGAPTKAVPTSDLIAWMDRTSSSLYISAVTVAEIEDGIAKCLRTGAARRAERMTEWLEALLHLYASRILPIDVDIARRLGRLADRSRASGHAPGLADLAIAATAHAYGYTILTRNLRHFLPLNIPAVDPFEALPDDI